MATAEASIRLPVSVAEAWDAYFWAPGWPRWVDGFAAVVGSEGYPELGGILRWQSIPAGRGEVSERVLEHEHRRLHRVGFADPTMAGEFETRFAITGDGAELTQTLDYRVVAAGPITRVAAALFVRSQVRASLERSLSGFREFVEESGSG